MSVFEILYVRFCIFVVSVCVYVLCGIVLQASANRKCVCTSALFVQEHVFRCVRSVYTNVHAFSSLPQVGGNRMTAVKRAEESRGWDSVIDNDSQQACGRAQPQALDSSPGEAGEMPAPENTAQLRVEGKEGANTDVKQRNKVTVCTCSVFVCVFVCMHG